MAITLPVSSRSADPVVAVNVCVAVVSSASPVSGDPATGEGPFAFQIVLVNNTGDALLTTATHTLTATTGAADLLDTGSVIAIYQVQTDADGLFEGALNDVVGGSGVTVVLVTSVLDGNGKQFGAGPVLANVVFD